MKTLVSLVLCIVFVSLIWLFIKAADIDNAYENNVKAIESAIAQSESRIDELPLLGVIDDIRPLMRNSGGFIGAAKMQISGTILTLETGQSVGIDTQFDLISPGTQVRVGETVNNKRVICLYDIHQTHCSMERVINVF